MARLSRVKQFEKYIQNKVPGFEVRLKGITYPDDPWYRPITEKVARFFCPTFDTDFATTMYPFVYVPKAWLKYPNTMYSTLRHEYIHLRDEQKYGWIYRLSYILLLPAVFTMRSFWERRGYTQNLIQNFEKHGKVGDDNIKWIISNFTSDTYAWMDPFFSHAKIMKLVKQVESKEITGLYPYEEGDWKTLES